VELAASSPQTNALNAACTAEAETFESLSKTFCATVQHAKQNIILENAVWMQLAKVFL
jgi:hypothetical protein